MTAIELAWEKEQKLLDQEIHALGIERALILWMRGGEIALNLQKQATEQIRDQYRALSHKSAEALRAKKST